MVWFHFHIVKHVQLDDRLFRNTCLWWNCKVKQAVLNTEFKKVLLRDGGEWLWWQRGDRSASAYWEMPFLNLVVSAQALILLLFSMLCYGRACWLFPNVLFLPSSHILPGQMASQNIDFSSQLLLQLAVAMWPNSDQWGVSGSGGINFWEMSFRGWHVPFSTTLSSRHMEQGAPVAVLDHDTTLRMESCMMEESNKGIWVMPPWSALSPGHCISRVRWWERNKLSFKF